MDQIDVLRPNGQHVDLVHLPLQRLQVFDGKAWAAIDLSCIEPPARLQHVAQMVIADVVAVDAEQEAIEQGRQGVVFGQTVAGAHDHQQRQLARFAAAAEDAFVEHHQQAVEDGAVGVEQFVQEHERRLGEHAFRIGRQLAFAQLADIERAEQLVRLGEPREQVIEDAAFDAAAQFVHQGAFGGAGRAENEQVLAAGQADAEQVDDFVLADKRGLERRQHVRDQAAADFGARFAR